MERFKFKDRVEVIVYDGDRVTQRLTPREDASIFQKLLGVFGLRKFTHDYVTDSGIADVSQYLYDNYRYVSIGLSDLGPSDASYVDLVEPYERIIFNSRELISTLSYNDTIKVAATIVLEEQVSIKEIGIHKQLDGGVMFARQIVDEVIVDANHAITIIWTIQIVR